jgi:hypothetical protein
MDHVEIEHVIFMCRKIRKRALITCLMVTPDPCQSSQPAEPDLTAFDCSAKKDCGVWIEEGHQVSHNWAKCIHPNLSKQESWTE